MSMSERRLNSLFTLSQFLATQSFEKRIQGYLQFFLGTPYGQGEILTPKLDTLHSIVEYLTNNSHFSIDCSKLDCQTLVEWLLALVNTNTLTNQAGFKVAVSEQLACIQFKQAETNFLTRNHFISLDWIENNRNYVTDITASILPECLQAKAEINKFNWLCQHQLLADLLTLETVKEAFAKKIKQKDFSLETVTAKIPYIPLAICLDDDKSWLDRMPAFSIINIVRPNWEKKVEIGTNLNVSHMGICLKKTDATTEFWHATTSKPHQVVNEDFLEYLAKCSQEPTIGGINILAIHEVVHGE